MQPLFVGCHNISQDPAVLQVWSCTVMPKHKTPRTFRRKQRESVQMSQQLAGAAVDLVCDFGPSVYRETAVAGESDGSSGSEVLSSGVRFSAASGHDAESQETVLNTSEESLFSKGIENTGDSNVSIHGSDGDSGAAGVAGAKIPKPSSDGESSSVDQFRNDLRWSITNGISHQALNELNLAKNHPCFSSLPTQVKRG